MSEPNAVGRPSKYSNELADLICERISGSREGLHKICEDEAFPCYKTVFNWLSDPSKDYFLQQYARAREAQADFFAKEILEISDDASSDILKDKDGNEHCNTEFVQRSRLRVDSRKWLASKLAPKKYGDKLDLTSDGKAIQPITGMIISNDATKVRPESKAEDSGGEVG